MTIIMANREFSENYFYFVKFVDFLSDELKIFKVKKLQ